jgi:hypothetical protein
VAHIVGLEFKPQYCTNKKVYYPKCFYLKRNTHTTNDLNFFPKKLNKEKQLESNKMMKRRRAEINETENRQKRTHKCKKHTSSLRI